MCCSSGTDKRSSSIYFNVSERKKFQNSLQKSHPEDFIDLTGKSYHMVFAKEISVYWLYHLHVRGFFLPCVILNFFTSQVT